MIKKILKEPLFHFLLLGALIFILYAALHKGEPDEKEIIVSQQQVEELISNYKEQWHKPPSETELQTIIADFIEEEVLYREAIQIGLDKDDKIVRRRLAQKYKFIITDNTEPQKPTEAELKNYLEKNNAKYQVAQLFSFHQITFLGGEESRMKAIETKATILNNTQPEELKTVGNQTALPFHIADKTQEEVNHIFGEAFCSKLNTLEKLKWQGPVQSGFGYHLIFIDSLNKQSAPDFEKIKSKVTDDFMNDKREQMVSDKRKEIISKYHVTVSATQ